MFQELKQLRIQYCDPHEEFGKEKVLPRATASQRESRLKTPALGTGFKLLGRSRHLLET